MQMTNEEIVRDYNAAANKSKQIKILAELNTVSPSEIRAVLAEAGVAGVEAPKRIVQRKAGVQGPAPVPDQTDVSHHAGLASTWEIYDRIETILSALPADASKCARDTAGNLAVTLFRDHVKRRLDGGIQDEASTNQ